MSELTYTTCSIKVKLETWLTSTSKAALCIDAKLTALIRSRCTLIYIWLKDKRYSYDMSYTTTLFCKDKLLEGYFMKW